jgi:hypothetical protein
LQSGCHIAGAKLPPLSASGRASTEGDRRNPAKANARLEKSKEACVFDLPVNIRHGGSSRPHADWAYREMSYRYGNNCAVMGEIESFWKYDTRQ